MIIYLSMIIWVYLMSAFLKRRSKRNLYLQTNGGLSLNIVTVPEAVVTFAYITFWAGMRTQFVDTAAYIYSYETLPLSWDMFVEELRESNSATFLLYEYLCKQVSPDSYRLWLMSIAIISSAPIIAVFRKRSDNYFYSVMLFLLSVDFSWMMNGIRQFVAVAILFGCCYFLEKRKPIHWILAVLALTTIHNSAWIALPMYWFVTGKPFGKKMLLFILGIMMVAVLLDPLMSSAEEVFAGTRIGNQLDVIAEGGGMNVLRLVVALVPVFLAYLNRGKIEKMNDRFMNICINMATVSAGIYFIASLTSGVMVGRFPLYFQLYSWILLPNIFERCYGTSKSLMYTFCTLGYLLWFYLIVRGFYYNSDITGFIQ